MNNRKSNYKNQRIIYHNILGNNQFVKYLKVQIGVHMSSVFKKLISKELGLSNYERYFFFLKMNIGIKNHDNKLLYNDMYEKLKNRDLRSIALMHDRLNETILLAFRISKTYLYAFLFFLAVCVFLVLKNLNPVVTIVALLSIVLCFAYKTYEFIINKFCYIDAQMILIYKAVLDFIILSERDKTNLEKELFSQSNSDHEKK